MVQSTEENQYQRRKEYLRNYYNTRYHNAREAQAYAHAGKILEAIKSKRQAEQVQILQEYILNNFKFKVQTADER